MATNYLNENLKDKELVDVVNKAGAVIGRATRGRVYREGLLHPAVNIVVVNKKGQIFIQQRSPRKILPLYWDISASEHVKSGEDYESAAVRGLKEELSIIASVASVKLLREKHIQRNEYIKEQACFIEYELVEFYDVLYDGEIRISQEEVAAGKFIFLEELNQLIKSKQIKFSPWGLEEINYLLENPKFRDSLLIAQK